MIYTQDDDMSDLMNNHKEDYALFFDIDGTLVSFNSHEIPSSTVQALTLAKANGSKVYIATGRPPLIITNLSAIEHLIDGYVTTNGALCFVGDELVCCQPIPKQDVLTCVEDAKAKGYSLIVVGRKDVAVFDPKGDVERIFHQMLAVNEFAEAAPLDVVLQQDVLQLTPFISPDYEKELREKTFQRALTANGMYICACCGKKYSNRLQLQVDHIIPLNRGGKTTLDNLQILCRSCNGRKGDKL